VLPLAQARGCQDWRRLTSPCAKAVPLVRGSDAMVWWPEDHRLWPGTVPSASKAERGASSV